MVKCTMTCDLCTYVVVPCPVVLGPTAAQSGTQARHALAWLLQDSWLGRRCTQKTRWRPPPPPPPQAALCSGSGRGHGSISTNIFPLQHIPNSLRYDDDDDDTPLVVASDIVSSCAGSNTLRYCPLRYRPSGNSLRNSENIPCWSAELCDSLRSYQQPRGLLPAE